MISAEPAPHHAAHSSTCKTEGRRQVNGDHLIPILVAQLHKQIVLGDPGIGHEYVELAHDLFGTRHEGFCFGAVGEIAREHMHALAEIGGEAVERFALGAGERDRRTLCMEDARYAAADRAARSCDQCGLPGEFKHVKPRERNIQARAAAKRATSSGVPIDDAVAPSAIRLIKPASTLPDPIS